MIEWIIRRSDSQPFLVVRWLLLAAPVVPCLMTCQILRVIIKTSYPAGPRIVENPVTLSLTTTMLSVHGAVRGFHSSVIRMCMSF